MDQHESVLLAEVVAGIEPKSGGRYIDVTCGFGGHTEAILRACSPDGRVTGFDRDPDARRLAQKRLEAFKDRCDVRAGRFSELAELVEEPVDGIVADLGMSSMQLDDAERGFSFRGSAPLDMRMSQEGRSAADLLSKVDASELSQILRQYGEVVRPGRVARAILRARDAGQLETTKDLADVVAAVVRSRPGIHPATRVFQAIRIAVNEELEEIRALLDALPNLLVPGGRVAIISFHSLEDRMVKHAFRDPPMGDWPRGLAVEPPKGPFSVVNRKPILPTEDEISRNPRARSAKLRVAERRAL